MADSGSGLDHRNGRLYTVWWTDDLLMGWPSGQVFTTSGGNWINPGSADTTQRIGIVSGL